MFSPKIKLFFVLFIFLSIVIPVSVRAITIEPVAPNDPLISNQYYLQQIQADKAWNFTVGSEKVIVAVIDSGVDLEHPDLKDNIWLNQDEIPDNQIDDDNNGYIDDVYGWNFVDKNNNPNPHFITGYTEQGVTHGTLVAGLIAASGNNNQGIAGIAWKTKIMALRAISSNGEGKIEHAVSAIKYASDNGADVINMSFVGSQDAILLKEAIRYAYQKGVVIVAAVGNDGLGIIDSLGGNLDTNPIYPVCYDGEKSQNQILGVGSVDKEDIKTDFSNFGKTCIDINAPGVNFVSTQVYNPDRLDIFSAPYSGYWNGTSFSTGLVSGTIALMKSIDKNIPNNKIISYLLNATDKIDSKNLNYKNLLGKGRLNVLKAVRSILPIGYLVNDEISPNQFKAVWLKSYIPVKISPNSQTNVSFQFKNTGTKTWHRDKVYLSIYDENDKRGSFRLSKFIPTNKISFNEQTVGSGSKGSFNFILKSPNLRGVYTLRFQLVAQDNGVEKNILGGVVYKTVELGEDVSGFMTEYNAPLAVLYEWHRIPIYVEIKNTGTSSWQRDELVLRVNSEGQIFKDKSWLNDIALAHPQEEVIKVGDSAIFKFYFNLAKTEKKVHYFEFSLVNKQRLVEFDNSRTTRRVMRVD